MRKTIGHQITKLLAGALNDAQRRQLLPSGEMGDLSVERPQDLEHGDFASSAPLKLARPMRMDPMAIAETLASQIPVERPLERVWAARPGFINFALSPGWLAEQVDTILQAGPAYGNVDVGAGQRVQVEFVSVNPTGPLHVAHARGAVIGSTLANILTAAGYEVVREYYFNDAGTQIDMFNRSLYARYQKLFGKQAEVPPDGYQGEYMIDLAQELRDEEGERFLEMPEQEGIREIGKLGLQKMRDVGRADVDALRVQFDVWFTESSLYGNGQYESAMDLLRERGYVVEKDEAVWFRSTALGEDQDKVLVRSNGEPTYFATDVAYHYEKFLERKFDRVINVLGADHQGHVAHMKPVVAALGVDPERLTLIVHQMVTLKRGERGEEVVRVSKRAGDLVTLRELVDEVGPEACRFFFLSRSPESQLEFNLDLAKEQSSENPVYYIQYAHARITSILRLAQERGIDYGDGDLSLLTHEAELALIRKMLVLPELVEMMARSLEPHHLPHYSVELATAFHWFYERCRVVSSAHEDTDITRARLKLVEAALLVLARCLGLMSMEAPEQMWGKGQQARFNFGMSLR